MGENLQREWDEDPLGDQLWNALCELTSAPSVGLESLTALAECGSPVAMLYLGDVHEYGQNGLPIDRDAAEYWFRKSAEAGSIEGRFQLANLLGSEKRSELALAEWEALSNLGFSPAIFYLGYCHYKGLLGLEVDYVAAHKYWRRAMRKGHLHAGIWLASSYENDGYGIVGKLRGFGIRLKSTLPMAWHYMRYPTSDRLRLPWVPDEMAERLKEYSDKHGVVG